MSEKLCVFCNHFQMFSGHQYSTMTQDPDSIGCDKGHWESFGTGDDFREGILKAATCPDYDEAKP